MPITLKNKQVRLVVEKAGERYRGSRFDWNGLVSSVTFRGVEVLGQEKPFFQRNSRLFGRGLHNEFGITHCIGYDDCAVGEWFPKIGTGWLKKTEQPYFFYNQYELEKLDFSFERENERSVRFSCSSGERNGYSYSYDKTITLEDSSFTVSYRLENTGDKTLETDEYVHNFLCVSGKRIGPEYRIQLPWTPDPAKLIENNNPDGIMHLEGNSVRFSGTTQNQFYLGGLSEGITECDGLAASWKLDCGPVSVVETGSFKPSAVHLWGWKKVISPEVFFRFRLESGNIVTWERTWTVSAI